MLQLKRMQLVTIAVLLLLFSTFAAAQAPTSFSSAKVQLKNHVYYDQNKKGALGTSYCGCDWEWVGRSGGRVDLESCGYAIRAQEVRAKRTEIEHIVTAYAMGSQRQCWQNGGRKNCIKSDPEFGAMEANLFNLTVVIGEVNADRSNYRYGLVAANDAMYGRCESKTDFKNRVFEPRDEVKGLVARTNFYIHDRYNLRMSTQQQKLFMAWDAQFPVTAWERERNRRIAKIMGHDNEFVTGKRKWTLNHKNRGDGISKTIDKSQVQRTQQATMAAKVHGNSNSKIYHLPNCPSYNAMKPQNRVGFANEAEAQAAGYRKAKNCP